MSVIAAIWVTMLKRLQFRSRNFFRNLRHKWVRRSLSASLAKHYSFYCNRCGHGKAFLTKEECAFERKAHACRFVKTTEGTHARKELIGQKHLHRKESRQMRRAAFRKVVKSAQKAARAYLRKQVQERTCHA